MTTSKTPTASVHLDSDEPPQFCPVCGQGLSDHPYYQEGPGRSAKMVRKIALGLMPIMAIGYLYWLFFGDTPVGFGTGHGYFAVAVIAGPSFLLYTFSRILPRVRNVICLRCSWNQEYPLKRF